MEIFINIIIFITGTLFGSFCTLAVYRIPRGEDIIIKHSYCPNCNHKLGILDLFPIFSYIFLRGKCRYCGQKIRIRYLILEIISGLVFLIFTYSLKINWDITNIDYKNLIYLSVTLLYFVTLFIIAGIDKEKIQIQKSVIVFGLLVHLIYMIYVYTLTQNSIYAYVIFLAFMLVFLIIDTYILKQTLKENYALQVLVLCMYILINSDIQNFILTLVMMLYIIMFEQTIFALREKIRKNPLREEKQEKKLPIGFYICISNIVVIIISNLVK